MNFRYKLAGIVAGTGACLALGTTAKAQVSADALLDKLVAKGILKQDEAQQLKNESTNSTGEGTKFKLSPIFKSMELYGDLRLRYEYRAATLGHEAGPFAGVVDSADRWRYALRLGVRGDLYDDFYYGLRVETGANERSTWNTFGNAGSGQSPFVGPFSKANNYSIFIGLAYLGWRPTSWLDVSLGRVPQPLYTTSMVWDSDYTPEGAVEKLKYTIGPADYFATFGQYVYQDTTPGNSDVIVGGLPAQGQGDSSDENAYLLAWQAGVTYHVDTNLSVKVAPVFYSYFGHGSASSGFSGTFVGQGVNGFTYGANNTTGSSVLPGTSAGYNQTGINDLSILEIPMQIDFKLWSLDARAFGDFSINFQGDDRARAAFNAGEVAAAKAGNPNPFPGGAQLNQDQAMQFGFAVGNNLDLVYSSKPRKGTWEARVYWQHVEEYALDPNLLDSDFFEGRGNLQGIYAAFAYSFSDAMIGTVRYGNAARINNQLGTGGFNADLPLVNPVNRYQLVQVDLTLKF